MALDFNRIDSEVSETETVEASAAVLLTRIAEEIRAGAGDQARMLALADRLDASQQALAAAIANVPGEGASDSPSDSASESASPSPSEDVEPPPPVV